MNKKARFRQLLSKEGIIVAPGAYDALSARIIEKAGFDTIYVTGFGVSASLLAMPDIGILTRDELVNCVKNIDNAVLLPVLADAESGFGNAVNVTRAVREFEKAGAVAIHIEDQVLPRRHTLGSGVEVVPAQEHINKIRAALEARENKDFLIIGRTDAREKYGLKEAIRRGNLYAEAGADIIFVHGPRTIEELRMIAREVKAPNIVNYATMIESGNKPILSISQLEEIGFKIVIFPSTLLFTAARSMLEALTQLKSKGTTEHLLNRLLTLDEFNRLTKLSRFRQLQDRYLPEGE
jgi:2-methylisocitrate lyase-like PEP mutase family enzyme